MIDFESARANLEQARATGHSLAAAMKEFSAFTDPRGNVDRLPDQTPFVLLPVRLETRFGKAGGQDQLWVRIYPDDISIDTFEQTLSNAEVANAKLYWQRIWAADHAEAGERAAWRALASAHGSGRAGYIVETFTPTNLGDQPTKAHPDDEILVIGTGTPLAAPEATAISDYWTAVWSDPTTELQAAAALAASVGNARAADLIAQYAPFNLSDPPTAGKVSVAFVEFPADPPAKQASWSQAPHVAQFPERFVVLGYVAGQQVIEQVGSVVATPLYVGPDPSAQPADGIHVDVNGNLVVPDQLQWLVDFERAKAAGMGIAIDLTPEQARTGFDRLIVLGLQMGTSADAGKTGLEELLNHHRSGTAGLALIPQGTPAHNTSGAGAGYTRLDDPDVTFDDRKAAPLFTPVTDPNAKQDGQWVAEALGIDPAVVQSVHAAGGVDQAQSRAMQRALWPATLGYWLDKMMTPVFSDATVAGARWFFTNFVSGRGAVPAIRVNHQPYGILPTTAFSRIAWPHGVVSKRQVSDRMRFVTGLLRLLREVDADWSAMSAGASHVGSPGDAHKTLMNIISLHPSSVEYHWRYSESLTELYNVINLWGWGPEFWQAVVAVGLAAASSDLLTQLGAPGATPDILQHAFMTDAGQLQNVIDDRPLSETAPVRPYTTGQHNYLHWLITAAGTSLDALRQEQGFTGNVSPQALLYLMLRHALMLGYNDAGYEFHSEAGFLTAVELQAMKPEPAFIHIDTSAPVSESRFAQLYKTEPRITGQANKLVADYIAENMLLPPAAGLADQIDALKTLADAPTAQLERLFAEHIDTCSYRFDAWLLGVVNLQLDQLRGGALPAGLRQQRGQQEGSYLGAYAWVEDLRPSAAPLEPVRMTNDVEKDFLADRPLVHDPSNGGYIHAPSIPHARTAAVLRSGYVANATQDNPQTLSVNLSSDRVRAALAMLEGVRNGQSIGALLGYQFERTLHDDFETVEVDKFIYPLRKAFPLASGALASTVTPPDVPIEAVEARNVIDGRKLAEAIRAGGANARYPFGAAGLPQPNATEQTAIESTAQAILNTLDAVAELALAEGVHQAVQGNFERVAATTDAYANATFPPDPEVVQTPTVGVGLTHRVALHLQPGLTAPVGATPRAVAEPALEAWLASMLPPLNQVGCTVVWTDPGGAAHPPRDVTLAELEIGALDLLALLKPDDQQAVAELDDRIARRVFAVSPPRPDARLKIQYQVAPAGMRSIFGISAQVRRLRELTSRARPLQATDAVVHNNATPAQDATVTADKARIAVPLAALEQLATDLKSFVDPLGQLLKDPVTNRAAIIAGLDANIDQAVELLTRAARFGLPQSGWGFAYAWRRETLAALMAQVDELVTRWQTTLTNFDAAVQAYDLLPAATGDAARFAALQAAEALISSVLVALPPTPATLRAQLNSMRADFDNKLLALQTFLGTAFPTFAAAYTAIQAAPAISTFDSTPFEIAGFGDSAVEFAKRLVANMNGQQQPISDRVKATSDQLLAYDNAPAGPAKVAALQAAAKALLGEAFVLIPDFSLAAAQGNEWAQSLAAPLLDYLKTTVGIDRPVADWTTGLARARPQLRAWEGVAGLSEALGLTAPELTPAQFPYTTGEHWLAMDFPPKERPASDRLLYTAHYATPFDPSARQCGLLLDEWTEVIPGTDHDTAVTFNFARPDNEPPQAILVVTPATWDGLWHWEDLVGALNETLDLAKKRALEPAQIDDTAYARFLPATIMAATTHGISISLVLAAAEDLFASKELLSHA